jgi:5-methylcytosine-specific restriction endonuclease McrA
MTLMRFCLACNGHHPIGHACARREAQRYAASRERRTRGTAKWKKARTLARQRDRNRCVHCGSDKNLQVHHRVALKNGGAKYDLANLETVCSGCHAKQHGGYGSTRIQSPVHPVLVFRETNSGDELLVG